MLWVVNTLDDLSAEEEVIGLKKKSHPGFKSVQKKIEGEGYGKKSAGAILANASRKASPSAKRKNPRLKKV